MMREVQPASPTINQSTVSMMMMSLRPKHGVFEPTRPDPALSHTRVHPFVSGNGCSKEATPVSFTKHVTANEVFRAQKMRGKILWLAPTTKQRQPATRHGQDHTNNTHRATHIVGVERTQHNSSSREPQRHPHPHHTHGRSHDRRTEAMLGATRFAPAARAAVARVRRVAYARAYSAATNDEPTFNQCVELYFDEVRPSLASSLSRHKFASYNTPTCGAPPLRCFPMGRGMLSTPRTLLVISSSPSLALSSTGRKEDLLAEGVASGHQGCEHDAQFQVSLSPAHVDAVKCSCPLACATLA